MQYVLCLIGAIVFNMGSGILYKASSNQSDKKTSIFLISLGLILGIFNVLLYTFSLKKIRLNVAYPIFSGGSIILITLFSIIFFNEAISMKVVIGVLTVCIGIFVISS